MRDMGSKTKLVLKNAYRVRNAEEAKKGLQEVDTFCGFWEMLLKYDKPDLHDPALQDQHLQNQLNAGLLKNFPDRNKESVSRNVRNWKNGGTGLAISRETAIELAFILKLDLDDADSFLAATTESGFRWRNPDEIVFAYAILHGMDYPAALELRKRIGEVKAEADKLPAQGENLTELAYQKLTEIQEESELKTYLQESASSLGDFHNKAFIEFERMYDCLKKPAEDEGAKKVFYASLTDEERDALKDKELSARDILETYLFRSLVPSKAAKKGNYGTDANQQNVLKNILKSWPDETTLSKMQNRQVDVTRKVLILLFLATNGGLDYQEKSETYNEYGEYEPPTRAEVFKDNWKRINRMLEGCGFNRLYARAPFDWIVIYALSVNETYETDEKLSNILKSLFGGNNSQNSK